MLIPVWLLWLIKEGKGEGRNVGLVDAHRQPPPPKWAQGKANSQKDVIKVRCMGTGQ